MPPPTPSGEVIYFEADDGFVLSGRFFEHPDPRDFVLICCATAVSQSYYWNFARYLVANGYSVLTFDYRGIGRSVMSNSVATRPESESHSEAPSEAPFESHSESEYKSAWSPLRGSPHRKQDWGELDMPAALEWLFARADSQPVNLVGHSAGGVLVGLMPNFQKLKKVVAVGCSTGYVGGIAVPFRFIAFLLLNVYFPIALKLFGYLPAKRLNLGEDLPAGVARQWATWCNSPGYVSNAFGKEVEKHHYDDFDGDLFIVNAEDDPITTRANTDSFVSLLPKARIRQIYLKPADFALEELSHMGYFRARCAAIWPVLLKILNDSSPAHL